jgi:glycerol-3-phosphate dehydrogenase
MQRNLERLANSNYDILVVGGGIYGACMAWEASSRGLSVALIEKSDFGSATSANSLKIIHGGLRYLQHADFKRMRESIQERKNLLKIAPHLIHPLKILVPTYGHGIKGREAMSIALFLNDLISCDRNWSIANHSHQIPASKVISKTECLKKLPDINPDGLTGGALFTDAQVYNSERLTLAFLQSACTAGAQIANYAKLTHFIRDGDRVIGATILDTISGQTLDVTAKLIINTTGPWIHEIQDLLRDNPSSANRNVILAKAVNLVVPKFIDQYAVGLSSRDQATDQDALLDKGNRFLFTVPWRHASMVGTWYFPFRESPDQLGVSQKELQSCLDDINTAYPAVHLSLKDIEYVHCGLLPSKGVSRHNGDVQLAKHYQLIDHRKDGFFGLLTVSGVKYTTARDVAQKVVDQVADILQVPVTPSQTHQIPIYGGNIQDFDSFLQQAEQEMPEDLSIADRKSLIYTYGTQYQTILDGASNYSEEPTAHRILRSAVRYAVREEMAQHLSDIVLRRTDLGSAGKPENPDIELCADTMTDELGWDVKRRQMEVQHIEDFYIKKLPCFDEHVATIAGSK